MHVQICPYCKYWFLYFIAANLGLHMYKALEHVYGLPSHFRTIGIKLVWCKIIWVISSLFYNLQRAHWSPESFPYSFCSFCHWTIKHSLHSYLSASLLCWRDLERENIPCRRGKTRKEIACLWWKYYLQVLTIFNVLCSASLFLRL